MTYAEFLAKLRETPREWVIDDDGAIRLGCQCPITSVHPDHAGSKWWYVIADKLGLRPGVTQRILYAADTPDAELDGSRSRKIRRDLLDACGLTETR